jgi:hypothetical protein
MQAARSTDRSVTASCIVASELTSKTPSPSTIGTATEFEHAKNDPTPNHGAYASARFNMDASVEDVCA